MPRMADQYAGRALRLPFPPVVEHMGDLANEASRSVEANTGHPLSFTAESVALVDEFLGEIRDEIGGSDELAELIFKLGCYLGEMIVRHKGGVWVDAPAELGGWPGVRTPDGYWADPISKAFKRVDNGPEDSIVSFYDLTGSLGGPKRKGLFRRRS